MKIVIASDHAGFELKKFLLKSSDHHLIDCGTNSLESVDYPDYAHKALEQFFTHQAKFGILICNSGIGMSIAANRNTHIRAALCRNIEDVSLARAHNDANFIILGAKFIDQNLATQLIEKFFNTEFEGGRHSNRVQKL